MKLVYAVFAAVILSACTTEGLVNAAFSDREMLAFRSASGEEVMRYACVPGPSEAETQARAAKAHRYVDTTLLDFGEKAAEAMIRGMEEGRSALSLSVEMNRSADAIAQEIQTTAESRYQCMYVGNIEV